jgi:hypothetical protein
MQVYPEAVDRRRRTPLIEKKHRVALLRAIGKVQRRTGWRAFKVWFVSTNHA